MLSAAVGLATRFRLLIGRGLVRLGFREDTFLVILAVLIGVVTAAAAMGFHTLIHLIRESLYENRDVDLYAGQLWLLVVIPAAGGLAVGVVSRFIFRIREGHGIIDVLDSVIRSSGVVRPLSALEKIVTSGLTIGTGGSAGAEGPIVQIGAGIASGIGQLFRISRTHMPILIGCGCAAGISAIFNSPIGGVLFTLEVILLEFSIKTFTPLVLASVIANVTLKAIFAFVHHGAAYEPIFAIPYFEELMQAELRWSHVGNFVLLGLFCGLLGVGFTRFMHLTEGWFARLRMPAVLKPALGGAILGLLGVGYVVVIGWWMLDAKKPIEFRSYALPAFFSDGYAVIRQLLVGTEFYEQYPIRHLLVLLVTLLVLKLLATASTLSSGGSGGIIAPSLFLGAVCGALFGVLLRVAGYEVQPSQYALVGMGAVLAAVVHAPLASILILLDLTQDSKIVLPAMLATVVATGVARAIFRDSIYTLSLRSRGVRVGMSSDLTLLRRLRVEQVKLAPATFVHADRPLENALDLIERSGSENLVVLDQQNAYVGMLYATDLRAALMDREAMPLLLVRDVARSGVRIAAITDDLAAVLDIFSAQDVDYLPVSVSKETGRIIGLVTRAGLMKRYQEALAET